MVLLDGAVARAKKRTTEMADLKVNFPWNFSGLVLLAK